MRENKTVGLIGSSLEGIKKKVTWTPEKTSRGKPSILTTWSFFFHEGKVGPFWQTLVGQRQTKELIKKGAGKEEALQPSLEASSGISSRAAEVSNSSDLEFMP
jgi:hypothetical protein